MAYRPAVLSESDSDIEQLEKFIGPQTPVYDTPKEAFQIFKILFEKKPTSKISTKKPCAQVG